MKYSSQQYAELLRKHPNLKPTEVIDKVEITKNGVDEVWKVTGTVKTHLTPSAFLEQAFSPVPPPPLRFTIRGQPVGSPRQTQRDKWRKRPCVVKYRDWCNKARDSVPKRALLMDYQEAHFIAYLEFPKSYSNKKAMSLEGCPHKQKPDSDNLLKSLLDALFKEDSGIWKVSGEKRWDDGQGARMEVELR